VQITSSVTVAATQSLVKAVPASVVENLVGYLFAVISERLPEAYLCKMLDKSVW